MERIKAQLMLGLVAIYRSAIQRELLLCYINLLAWMRHESQILAFSKCLGYNASTRLLSGFAAFLNVSTLKTVFCKVCRGINVHFRRLRPNRRRIS